MSIREKHKQSIGAPARERERRKRDLVLFWLFQPPTLVEIISQVKERERSSSGWTLVKTSYLQAKVPHYAGLDRALNHCVSKWWMLLLMRVRTLNVRKPPQVIQSSFPLVVGNNEERLFPGTPGVTQFLKPMVAVIAHFWPIAPISVENRWQVCRNTRYSDRSTLLEGMLSHKVDWD